MDSGISCVGLWVQLGNGTRQDHPHKENILSSDYIVLSGDFAVGWPLLSLCDKYSQDCDEESRHTGWVMLEFLQ